jgi:hypothetical protein
MLTRKLLTPLVAATVCLTLVGERPVLAAPSPPAGTEAILVKMIDAVKAESYDDFVKYASVRLKAQLSHQQFEGICGLYTAPLRKGYKLEYLGQLRQKGTVVLLWKITVTDSPDEALLRLVTKDGKVDGFTVH